MDMNNGWLGFSLSSSTGRGYGDGGGGGSASGDGEGSCSPPAAASPLLAMPLQSDASLPYASPGKLLIVGVGQGSRTFFILYVAPIMFS
jgi:hypothetical protein